MPCFSGAFSAFFFVYRSNEKSRLSNRDGPLLLQQGGVMAQPQKNPNLLLL
jgi:hypothetical protein